MSVFLIRSYEKKFNIPDLKKVFKVRNRRSYDLKPTYHEDGEIEWNEYHIQDVIDEVPFIPYQELLAKGFEVQKVENPQYVDISDTQNKTYTERVEQFRSEVDSYLNKVHDSATLEQMEEMLKQQQQSTTDTNTENGGSSTDV